MDRLLEIALANAAMAAILAIAFAWVMRWVDRPVVVRVLWLIVLVRLLMPPVVELALPFAGSGPGAGLQTADGSVAVVSAEAPAGADGARRLSFETLLLGAWLTGSLLFFAVSLLRTVRCRHLLDAATAAPGELQARVRELAKMMRIARVPQALLTEDRLAPMLTVGLRHSRLILPRPLLDRLSAAEVDGLIVHELAHLKRHDHWIRALELITLTLYWWYPVAWWARRSARRAEEACCDALVTSTLPGHRRTYAECLLKTTRFLNRSPHRELALASSIGGARDLERRLTMIMTRNVSPTPSLKSRWLLVAAAVLLLVLSPTGASVSAETDREFVGAPIDLEVTDVAVTDVIGRIAEVSGLNLVVRRDVDPSLSVTLALAQVPWDQALDRILADYGLASSKVGNLVWIIPEGGHETPSLPFRGEPISLKLMMPISARPWSFWEVVGG